MRFRHASLKLRPALVGCVITMGVGWIAGCDPSAPTGSAGSDGALPDRPFDEGAAPPEAGGVDGGFPDATSPPGDAFDVTEAAAEGRDVIGDVATDDGRDAPDVARDALDGTAGVAVEEVRLAPPEVVTREGIACLPGGWCFENPLPTSIALRAVSAVSPSDAWAAGDAGAIWHWDGRVWQPTASGVPTRITGIWAAGPADVWATTAAGVLRWDGSRWGTALASTTADGYVAVWGSSRADVWVAGRFLQHWDGLRWTAVASPAATRVAALHGTAPDNVWAAGASRALWRWDGARWLDHSLPGSGTAAVVAVWSAGVADTFAATADGYVRRWNGSAWIASFTPISAGWSVHALWGTAPDAVWATGVSDNGALFVMRWDGARWREVFVEGDEALLALGGSGAGDVWAVGLRSQRVRWDGARWRNSFAQARGSGADFVSVHASARDNLWAISGTTAWRWDGVGWAQIRIPVALAGQATAVWTAGPTETFITCNRDGPLLRWDGTEFRALGSAIRGAAAVWGTGRDNVWLVGAAGEVARWDGATLRAQATPAREDLLTVWGTSPTDVWAAGASGRVVHWDGIAWRAQTSGTAQALRRVGGTGRSDLWAVGGGTSGGVALRSSTGGSSWEDASAGAGASYLDVLGLSPGEALVTLAQPSNAGTELRRWNGLTWSRLALGTTANLRQLGGGADDLLAAGDRGALWRRQAGVWSEVPKTSRGVVTRIVDAGAAGRWAAGRDVLRWDGARWRGGGDATAYGSGARGIAVFSASDVWAVEDFARGVKRWDGITWTRQPGTESLQLRDIWGARPDDLWVVGGFGESLHWDGRAFARVAALATWSFTRVTGTAADDVWGYGLTVAHWNGAAWSEVRAPCPGAVLAARARDDVWVAGDGCFSRWDGARWAFVSPAPSFSELTDLLVLGDRDVWAVGVENSHASIKHYDGSSWTETVPHLEVDLRAITRDATGRLWVGGGGGTILTRAPE